VSCDVREEVSWTGRRGKWEATEARTAVDPSNFVEKKLPVQSIKMLASSRVLVVIMPSTAKHGRDVSGSCVKGSEDLP
jgi:hypothetical protein